MALMFRFGFGEQPLLGEKKLRLHGSNVV